MGGGVGGDAGRIEFVLRMSAFVSASEPSPPPPLLFFFFFFIPLGIFSQAYKERFVLVYFLSCCCWCERVSECAGDKAASSVLEMDPDKPKINK